MAAETDPDAQAADYAASMTTAQHLGVIAERLETGNHGDFEVGTSMATVVGNLGRMASQDMLSFADATDLVESRQRLESMTQGVDQTDRMPDAPYNAFLLGHLSGVRALLDRIYEIKHGPVS